MSILRFQGFFCLEKRGANMGLIGQLAKLVVRITKLNSSFMG